MKILVFHQPFPMGNYKLNETLALRLKHNGHEVYTMPQLNGIPATPEYINLIKEEKFDVIYYEMLDLETFKVVEQLDSLRILLVASRGIFKDFYNIIDYKGKYYDKVMTNSIKLFEAFQSNNVPCELFHFYFSAVTKEECVFKTEYVYDNVFLGMGFARQTDPNYSIENEIFFNSEKKFKFALFGNGWKNVLNYKGVLPPNDIGSLYSSALSASAIIGSGQRSMGMINNRYTEIGFCKCPIISYHYDIDWRSSDKYMNFVSSAKDLNKLVLDLKTNPHKYQEKTKSFYEFILQQDTIFFEKLLSLMK
jgi:hypothetical protein